MNILNAKVLENICITKDLYILTLEFPYPVKAGQFIMIKIPDNSRILPRPISIFNYNSSTNSLSLLIRQRGEGTRILSQMKQDSYLEIFGSFGNGFPTNIENKHIILMGGSEGIAPMLLTSNLIKNNNKVQIFAGFRCMEESKVLNFFDQNLDIQYTAQDHGDKKIITELLEKCSEPDYIYTCGPISMMEAIYKVILSKQWKTKILISMESHMACGVGACVGCTIKDSYNNPIKVCTEGPIFSAEEIFNV